MRQTEKGFTRRGFLTGSALALGGVAISAMGCAPAQKAPVMSATPKNSSAQ